MNIRPSLFLRTLALVALVMLTAVGNVHALVECKDKHANIWYCSDGDTCGHNDAGEFNGCCAGTICGDRDGERICCDFPTPNCGPLPQTCVPKPPKLPDGPCKEPGCIIGAETQTLGEVIQLVGTPFSLNYQSNLATRRHDLGLGGWSLSILHSYDSQSRTLYLGNGDQRSIPAANGLPSPVASILGISIAAEDGSELYVFAGTGRHLRTLDALTGLVRLQFTYDSAGRLATVTDGDDNVTTVERDGTGNPSAIIGPFGQRTALAVDTDGYLSRITNPAGEAVQLTYNGGNPKGLLARLVDPRGYTNRYVIHPLIGLLLDQTSTGGATSLARKDITKDHSSVTVTRASGQATTYEVEELPTGETRRLIDRSGVRTESVIKPDGSRRQTYADGSVMSLIKAPDPRFGMQAPINKSQTLTTPGGLVRTTTMERTANLTDPANPLSLSSQTSTVTINGGTYTRVYDAASHTFKDTTPIGRQRVTTLDTNGRPVRVAVGGIAPVQLIYDERGRLISQTQDNRTYTLTYNNQGHLSVFTDPSSRRVGFTYDAAGRVIRQTLFDGQQVRYDYDNNGNMTLLTPPGRPPHIFTYTAADQTEEYHPPLLTAGANMIYHYNLDKKISGITRPDGQLIDFKYDDAGRLSIQTTPNGTNHYAYAATTGRLNGITAADGGKLDFTYDGPLLTEVTSAGTVIGSIGASYDNEFRLNNLTINNANPVTFTYDADGQLTQAGLLILIRDAQNGLITRTGIGVVNDIFSYSSFGELVNSMTKVNDKSVLITQFKRDKLGRIIQKVETTAGRTLTHDYGYDMAGRLAQVKVNGTLSTSYTYDANGNRLSGPGVRNTAAYDNQDRLLRYGGSTYNYTANGELKSKNTGASITNYSYDVLGNLKEVALPTGTTISYLIDGQNRRIGKKVGGTLKQGFLYQDQLKPIAELDGANTVVSRFIYGTRDNVPEYMVKGGISYRIVTDHLGSPRMVINTTNGTVVQRMDYDEFGRVTADTAPGFQPFGFSGGLYDPDTKLVRFGARDYDAEIGRWTAKDPILFRGAKTNLYSYVGSDPINQIDPSGLQRVQPINYGPPVSPVPRCIDVPATAGAFLLDTLICSSCGIEALAAIKSGQPGNAVGQFIRTGGGSFCGRCFGPATLFTEPCPSLDEISVTCDDFWPGDPRTPTPCNPAPMCEAPPKEPNFTPAGPNRSGG